MIMNVIEIVMIIFFAILLLLVLYGEFICIKSIRKVEVMLQQLSPLIGHERTSMVENLKCSLEAIKQINRLFALRAQQDKEEDKRVLN